MRLIHRINHWLGFNTGMVVSEWREEELWIGFQCSKCGKVNGWHKSVKFGPCVIRSQKTRRVSPVITVIGLAIILMISLTYIVHTAIDFMVS